MVAALRRNRHVQEPFRLWFEHIQLTADTTTPLYRVPAGKKLRIDRVTYFSVAGLAEHADNWFDLRVIKGASTLIANYGTDSDLAGVSNAIPANTLLDIPLTAALDADAVVVGGAASDADLISLFYDETGTATLPAGRVLIEGRFV